MSDVTPSSPQPPPRGGSIFRRFLRLNRALEDITRDQTLPQRLGFGAIVSLRIVMGAGLAWLVAAQLPLEQNFWAAITAIAVSQNRFLDVAHTSRDQLIGAMVGGMVGMTGGYLAHGHLGWYLLALATAVMACWGLRLGSAARLAAITVSIVMLVPHEGPFWIFAGQRFAEVCIGLGAAVLVGWAVERIEEALAPTESE